MKNILLFLLLFTVQLSSQNLIKVDGIVRSYKSDFTIEELSKKIDYDFKTDLEKIRAAFYWLALNITYDISISNAKIIKSPELFIYFNDDDLKRRISYKNDEIVNETLRSKKAVCNGIALSFQKICNLLKIENELIKGYTQTNFNNINNTPKTKNHIWNAVNIKNRWVFVDVTFSIDNSNNYSKPRRSYFDISKNTLQLSHYPSEQKWRDIIGQNSLKKFCNQPIFSAIFFKEKVELLSPKKGEIYSKTRTLLFEFKNLKPYTEVKYGFENIIKKAKIEFKNDIANLELKVPNRNLKLTIYFNGKSALEYKRLKN